MMRTRSTPRRGLLAVAAALSLAGCGSSATHSSNTPQSASKQAASKAAFVSQAEKICLRLRTDEAPLKARQESLKGLAAGPSEKAFVTIAQQVVALSQKADEQLKQLPRPTADTTVIATMLDVYGDEITDVSDLARSAANQESTSGEAADSALKRAIAVDSTQARKFGIAGCTGAE